MIAPLLAGAKNAPPQPNLPAAPAPPPPQDAVVHALQEENARLQQEVARLRQQAAVAAAPKSGTIQFDMNTNTVSVRDLRTHDTVVERLDAHVPGTTEMMAEYFSAHNAVNNHGRPPVSFARYMGQARMEIQDLRLRIPQQTANDVIRAQAGDTMREAGVRNFDLRFEDGRLRATGSLKKFVPIPFNITGKLSASGEHQVKFALERARVLGVIPVPHLLARAILAITGEPANVQRKGTEFTMDVKHFIPRTVNVALDQIELHQGALVVEGKSPDAAHGAPAAPAVPAPFKPVP